MHIKKYIQLFKRYSELSAKEIVEYRMSFFLSLVSAFAFILVNLFFWNVIFGKVANINGWTIGQIFLIQAFFSLFTGIFYTFFNGANHISEIIVEGEIDSLLTKPVNPV
ncbi:MAG: ABC-2 family transporter protein, partial [Candidatus Micrarchaeota archaeon]